MKNKLSTKITAALLITSTLSSVVFTTHANAQAATSGTGANGPLLANAVAGKLLLKADVGYVYSFAGDWNKSNSSSPSIGGNTSTATGGVGYGVSLGWTSKTGFGLSADYLGFNHKWTGLGTSDATTQFNYDAPYHVMTITPSYRFRLDSADNWGLRIGLGVGFSLSDVSWAKNLSASGAQSGGLRVAGGAVYSIQSNSNDPYVNATSGATGDIHTCYHHLGNNRALGGIIADSNVETDNSGYTPLANKCYYTSDAN
ncbi:MAG: hypothetical protein QM529_07690, partial [Hydrotalea sp.]|nr:hypothetical protein [Hydrotalea sp.]